MSHVKANEHKLTLLDANYKRKIENVTLAGYPQKVAAWHFSHKFMYNQMISLHVVKGFDLSPSVHYLNI